jgi:regulator of protease activity HflC (stomatin/prohibitin superfamily)
MKLLQGIGGLFGLHFVPDNHVAPVLRAGLYTRVGGPGHFFVLPGLEAVKDPVSTAMKGDTHTFSELRTQDGIPLTIKLTVRYRFDPRSLDPNVARMLLTSKVGAGAAISSLLADTIEQQLRHLMATYDVEDVWHSHVRDALERKLQRGVAAQMKRVGVTLRDQSPIIVKDITTQPELTATLHAAKRHQILLDVLRSYEEADVDQTLMAELINGLADKNGNVSILALGELFGLGALGHRGAGPGRESDVDGGGRVVPFRRR